MSEFADLNKALQGQVSDQVDAVIQLGGLLATTKDAVLLNTCLLRLAELFASGLCTNLLRCAILQAAQRLDVHRDELAINSAMLVKHILLVTSSTDAVARAYALRLLGHFAPQLANHLEVHHKVREAMSSHDRVEVEAAATAGCQLAAVSKLFAATSLPHILGICGAAGTLPETRCRLLPMLRHMGHTSQLAFQAQQGAQQLLQGRTAIGQLDSQAATSLLRVLTELAVNCLITAEAHAHQLLDLLPEHPTLCLLGMTRLLYTPSAKAASSFQQCAGAALSLLASPQMAPASRRAAALFLQTAIDQDVLPLLPENTSAGQAQAGSPFHQQLVVGTCDTDPLVALSCTQALLVSLSRSDHAAQPPTSAQGIVLAACSQLVEAAAAAQPSRMHRRAASQTSLALVEFLTGQEGPTGLGKSAVECLTAGVMALPTGAGDGSPHGLHWLCRQLARCVPALPPAELLSCQHQLLGLLASLGSQGQHDAALLVAPAVLGLLRCQADCGPHSPTQKNRRKTVAQTWQRVSAQLICADGSGAAYWAAYKLAALAAGAGMFDEAERTLGHLCELELADKQWCWLSAVRLVCQAERLVRQEPLLNVAAHRALPHLQAASESLARISSDQQRFSFQQRFLTLRRRHLEALRDLAAMLPGLAHAHHAQHAQHAPHAQQQQEIRPGEAPRHDVPPRKRGRLDSQGLADAPQDAGMRPAAAALSQPTAMQKQQASLLQRVSQQLDGVAAGYRDLLKGSFGIDQSSGSVLQSYAASCQALAHAVALLHNGGDTAIEGTARTQAAMRQLLGALHSELHMGKAQRAPGTALAADVATIAQHMLDGPQAGAPSQPDVDWLSGLIDCWQQLTWPLPAAFFDTRPRTELRLEPPAKDTHLELRAGQGLSLSWTGRLVNIPVPVRTGDGRPVKLAVRPYCRLSSAVQPTAGGQAMSCEGWQTSSGRSTVAGASAAACTVDIESDHLGRCDLDQGLSGTCVLTRTAGMHSGVSRVWLHAEVQDFQGRWWSLPHALLPGVYVSVV